MADSYVMRFPVGGVNQASPAILISPAEVADAVNARVYQSAIRSRPGVVMHDLPGTDGLNFQGACFYNPSQGLSQQVIGQDDSMLVFSAGGRKFAVRITDEDITNSEISVLDVTSTEPSNPTYHTVWMAQAENYLICQDGNGPTWIWDGYAPAFTSSGYNTSNKEESQLANGASLVSYAHGRVVQVVNGRQILVGDIIHKSSLTDASNILGMTEQTYWATGNFFSPPSSLGKVTAIAILPLRNTTHGHGDLILHCEEGIFSLDISLYPREKWIEQSISKHLSLAASASGPYAIALYDSDQIFMTRNGIHSLRSAAAVNSIGNPQRPISEGVSQYIEREDPSLLRFASVEKSVRDNRLFATSGHLIWRSYHRGAHGVLTMNFRPAPSREFSAWEGLWTFPAEGWIVNQVVAGSFDGRERVFAFATGTDERLRLIEFSQGLHHDMMPDGKEKPIQWQFITRADAMGDDTTDKQLVDALATLKGVVGDVSVKSYIRTDQSEWRLYAEACFKGMNECMPGSAPSREASFQMGAPPSGISPARWVQFLFKIEGACSVESVRVKSSIEKGGESNGNLPTECVNLVPDEGNVFEFDPYSYSL